jgi:hypothetical protein
LLFGEVLSNEFISADEIIEGVGSGKFIIHLISNLSPSDCLTATS